MQQNMGAQQRMPIRSNPPPYPVAPPPPYPGAMNNVQVSLFSSLFVKEKKNEEKFVCLF